MNVRTITTLDELAALEQPWNDLAGDFPFRRWDWLATWWKYYGSDEGNGDAPNARQLRTIAVFDSTEDGDEKLAGVAPLYVERSRARGNVLRMLGGGEVCTDHLSLICSHEDQQNVAKVVADHLTDGLDDWDVLDLCSIDAGDEAIAQLTAALEQRECIVSSLAADACWVVDLPKSWDEYLALQSKSHRKQLRRLERRVLESDRAQWHRLQHVEEFADAWSALVDLHQRRRQSLGEPGCFASQPFHEFHRDVAQRFLQGGRLRLSWLALDDAPIAAEYHFAGDGATFAYQGGLDPDRLDEEPGRLSTILCVKAAVEEGHCRFDFMRGDEPYKAHWRAESKPTFDHRVVPNRRLARLRGRAVQLTGTMTDWLKSGTSIITGSGAAES